MQCQSIQCNGTNSRQKAGHCDQKKFKVVKSKNDINPNFFEHTESKFELKI